MPRPIAVTIEGRSSDLPYSPAVISTGRLVFVSGQLGRAPGSNEVPSGIAAQTAQALENVSAALKAAGTSLEYVCKVNVYLVNGADFAAMNEVYRKYFPQNPPARTTVGAALVRPEFLIEIDAIAQLPV
jgi:2-iminobutanoate/2-iminopropanoate deaminase